VRKEPAEARAAAAAEARAANAARSAAALEKAEARKRMKGKNKPSRRAARKKANIIEERKGPMRARVAAPQPGGGGSAAAATEAADAVPADVPRALHRFYRKRGT
jgi:U3 small nucleolar RNA-associated protein 7